MRTYLRQIIFQISGSYWFLPSIMTTLAIILSQLMIWLDHNVGTQWSGQIWFASISQPDGARALLSTVAGSMITVAGVTFSLTMVAVSHATSHFGPRLLTNFMHDRGNQITLGTFLATFLYCLLVLHVVRGQDVLNGDGVDVEIFVPHLAVAVALLLTLASVAELIYFIHHVPESIHISSVLKRLSTDMFAKIEELYPESLGTKVAKDQTAAPIKFERFQTVPSNQDGYIQGIDDRDLIAFATKNNLRVKLLHRPGDFVRRQEALIEVEQDTALEDSEIRDIRMAFTLGISRNPTQDVFFTLSELVEVAVRALSPGVNDPFTAMQCIDWLSAGFVQLSRRELPSPLRSDEQGHLRLITTHVTYNQFVESVVVRLICYTKRDRNVHIYLRDSLQRVIEVSENRELNECIRRAMPSVDQLDEEA